MRQLTEGEQKVIRAVLDMGEASRKDLSERVDLSPVLLVSTLNRLIAGEILSRSQKVGSRGGRPAYYYGPSPGMGHAVGVAVQGDAIRALAVDALGNVLARQEIPHMLQNDPGAQISETTVQVIKQVKQLLRSDSLPPEGLLSIGISIEGRVDSRRGIWKAAPPHASDQHVNLKWAVEERFKCPVSVEATPRAVAFYEKRLGQGREATDLVVLFLGSTVGAGVFVDGRLLLGHEGRMGDVAHIPVENDGQRCICGNVGCLQTFASVGGILRIISDRLREGVASTLLEGEPQGARTLTLEKVLKAAEQKDDLARTTVFRIGLGIGTACSTMVKMFDPGKLIISGPLSSLRHFLKNPIEHACEEKVGLMRNIDSMIEFASFAPEQEAIGAALIGLHARFGLVY